MEKLREAAPEQAAEFEDDIKWSRAVNKAQGVKVKVCVKYRTFELSPVVKLLYSCSCPFFRTI